MSGGRLEALAAAAFNSARLPVEAVTCDLSTDLREPAPGPLDPDPLAAVDAALRELLGPCAWLATPRGRVAEAALAAALVRPGQVVLANEVYVTGAWSIAREGGSIIEIGGALAEAPERGVLEDLDLERAARHLGGGQVACVWLTTPRVLLGPRGGATVDPRAIAGLVALRDRLAPAAPIVVDATKIGEWAARAALPGPPVAAVTWLFEQVDLVALSARKDAGGAPLGLLIARDPGRLAALRGPAARILGERPYLPAAPLSALARGLRRLGEGAGSAWRELDALAHALRREGAPVAGWGGGALFLDAERALPRVPRAANPAATLLGLLYLRAGIRGLGTPVDAHGPAIVRLSLRGPQDWLRGHLGAILDDARTWPSGLVADGPAPSPFLDPLRPIDPAAWSSWPEGRPAPASAGPAVLGADPAAALRAALRRRLAIDPAAVVQPLLGPRRRLAELWSRLARPDAQVVGDPALAQLAASWWRPPGGALGDLRIDLAARPATPRSPDELRVLDLGPPRSWPAALPLADGADLWLIDALDGGDVGALILRPGSPLARPLAEALLFTAGAPASGGIDDEVLAGLADA